MKLSKAFVWRTALVSMAVLATAMGSMIWKSGIEETQEAFFTGRRVVIDRETGLVHGKMPPASLPETEPQPIAAEETPPAAEENVTQAQAEPGPELPPLLDSFMEAEAQPDAAPPPPSPQPEAQALQIQKEDELKIAQAIKSAPILSSAPTITPSANALPEVKESLSENSEYGILPAIAADGMRAWKYYVRDKDYSKGTPAIALIVTGLGQNRLVTENALKLPEEVSLSFSPYSRDTMGWGKASRMSGHETLIDLPLEPSNYPVTDPGPKGLLVEKGAKENEKRLEWIMSRYPGSMGLLAPQNEQFSSDIESYKVLMQSVANRGLLMVLAAPPRKNETRALVEASATPLLVADLLIDEELSVSAIQTRLTALEALARKRGYAVGIIQPYPISVDQLRQWIETLKEKDIMLVPVSAIAKEKFS